MDTVDDQKRVRRWLESRLGPNAANNPHERAMRMLEEALELAQSIGVDAIEAELLLNHVYAKPPGDIQQELGGASTTLLACADGCGYILSELFHREMSRIESLPPQKFRLRQALNAELGIGAAVDTNGLQLDS
jgi:hypothetical protein